MVYPEDARAAHVSGTVRLHAIIGKDGSIKRLEVISGPPALKEAAFDAVGSVIELTNLTSTKIAAAQVVSLRPSKKGEVMAVGIELLTPSESFWGATFRLKMATDDLLKLEKSIRSGGMDARVLREFRDAVDYVRKTAWALQELQERQAHQRDTATVRSLLTEERVRRASQLNKALASDVDSHEVTDATPGVADLYRAVEGLYPRLGGLFKIRESQ